MNHNSTNPTSNRNSKLTLSLGKIGEKVVLESLQRSKRTVLKQNYRCRCSEIDLISLQEKTIYVTEVKTRTQFSPNSHLVLSELMPPKKIRALKTGILDFLYKSSIQWETIKLELIIAMYHPQTDDFSLQHYPDIE
jgi:putative endonuclease